MSQPLNGVNADDVKKIAKLSSLHVEPDAYEAIAIDLNGILAWIEQLSDCLLYTSPSPRDLSTSRMPSSA